MNSSSIIEHTKTKRGLLAFLLSLIICWSAGCSALPQKPTPPKLTVPTPNGPLNISGDAATAPEILTTQTQTETPVPADSQISFVAATATEPAKVLVTVKTPTVIRSTTNTQNVKGATSHQPPAPPSLTDQADAAAVTRSYWFAGGLALLAGLFVWRAHIKAAIFAGIGAVAVVPVTKFIGSTWGQVVVLLAIAVAVSLFAAWHFMNDKKQIITPSTS